LATSGVNWTRALRILDAANTIDPGFKILLMPDMQAEFKSQPENVLKAIRALAKHPAAYRLADGRLVLAPYNAQNQTVAWWSSLIATLKAEGISVAFFPVFQGWYKYAAAYSPISYGMSEWGTRSPGANKNSAATPALAHAYATKWMSTVSPQDSRPKNLLYTEAGNSQNYRTMWEGAIAGGADWAQIVTWNDYSEATEVAPSSGTQWSFYDLTAYYTAWFKTGVQPTVTRDVLYYFHRNQATTAVPDPSKQPRPYTLQAGSDAASNMVEVVAFAVTPATLQITVDTQTTLMAVPAGMSSFKVPLTEGRPVFKMLRNNVAVVTATSAFPISNTITYQDMLYRSGSSSRTLVAPR
jgi:hypothetical protein